MVLTFMIDLKFWWQILTYYFVYLFGEVFFGPSYAQINKIVDSQIQGLAVAIFQLTGAASGSLATYLLGVLGDHFDTKTNPKLYGRILGVAVLISYLGCIPFFLINSKEYAKIIQEQKSYTLKVLQKETSFKSHQMT